MIHGDYTIASDIVIWRSPRAAVVFAPRRGVPVLVDKALAADLDAHRGLPPLTSLPADIEDLMISAGVLDSIGSPRPPSGADGFIDKLRAAKTISLLDLVVSEGCNFGCPHCIHARDVATSSSRSAGLLMMPMETAVRAIDEFAALQLVLGHDDLVVHIGGAEPLTNWPVVSHIVTHVKGVTGFARRRVSMNSNLALLTTEHAQFLVDNGVQISTSLDGTRDVNDRIRHLKNGSGTYDVILSKLGLLRDLGAPLDSVNLTVTSATLPGFDVSGYLDLVEGLGMRGVALDFDLVGSAQAKPHDVGRFLLGFYREASRRGVTCYGTWTKPFENLFTDDDARASGPVAFCKAVEGANIAVSPDGSLFMCSYTSAPLGQLGDMATRFGPNLARLVEERTALVEVHCNGCALFKVCGGQCHATQEVATYENTDKVNMMCDVYRHVTQELAVAHAEDDWE